MANKTFAEFMKGLFKQNPVFVLVLGLCPALAVSTSLENALGMGLAATFVLLGSNIIISLIRKHIPAKIRIPSFIVVIATFVTIAHLFMQAYLPSLNESLGIYVPLIVVNCIILGRAEAYASKHGAGLSILDALGMGAGFTLALTLVSAIREFLGTGGWGLLGVSVPMNPSMMFILSPGAFLTIGLLMALFKYVKDRRAA